MYKEKYEALKRDIAACLDIAGRPQLPDEDLVSIVSQLRQAHDLMAERIRASVAAGETVVHVASTAPPPDGGPNGGMDSIYRYIVDRATKEPALLNLLVDRPELVVKVERRMINSSDASTQGRLALLLYEKFFDAAKDAGDVTREFKRRGWFDAKASNAALIKPLAQITEWGFLTKEEAGYQAVPGMKVNIVEARA